MSAIPSGGASRREFLKAGAATIAGMAIGGCSVFAEKTEPDLTVERTGDTVSVPIAQAAWLTSGPGQMVVAVAGRGEKILLFRTPGGSLAAVTTTCTHLGCDVEYDPTVGHIVCPCHGSEFDNDGAVRKGPAEKPLRSFPVAVLDDRVVITVA